MICDFCGQDISFLNFKEVEYVSVNIQKSVLEFKCEFQSDIKRNICIICFDEALDIVIGKLSDNRKSDPCDEVDCYNEK